MLKRIAREDVPAKIQTRVNLKNELAYGNPRSAAKFREKALTTARTDVALAGL